MHIRSYVDQIIDRQNDAAKKASDLMMKVATNMEIPAKTRMELIQSMEALSSQISKITSED